MRVKGYIENVMVYAALVVLTAVTLFPIFWALTTSIRTRIEMFTIPIHWIPHNPTFENYMEVFSSFRIPILNSLIVAISSVSISLLIACPAAYGFARYQFPGNYPLFVLVLLLYMFPGISIIVPFFILMVKLHLVDTLFGLILAHLTFQIPFIIWMMKGFFQEIPRELEDAARVDGCSRLSAFLRIILPVSKSGLAAVAILCFLGSWNEFLYALIITSSPQIRTAPVVLAQQVALHFIDWGKITAGGILFTLPTLMVAFLIQRHIVRGLSMGAIKG